MIFRTRVKRQALDRVIRHAAMARSSHTSGFPQITTFGRLQRTILYDTKLPQFGGGGRRGRSLYTGKQVFQLICKLCSSLRRPVWGVQAASNDRPPAIRPHEGRIPVSSEQPVLAGVAGRYASALFELALDVETGRGEGLEALASDVSDRGAISAVEEDLAGLQDVLTDSEDLRRFLRSPVYGREEQTRAMIAIIDRAGVTTLTRNFVSLVASNGRLFALEDIIRNFRALVANHRGEMSATVTSATALGAEHVEALKETLKDTLGQDVSLDLKVDESLIAGLVVKVGSRMIDSSLKTRLTNLKIAMKEVG